MLDIYIKKKIAWSDSTQLRPRNKQWLKIHCREKFVVNMIDCFSRKKVEWCRVVGKLVLLAGLDICVIWSTVTSVECVSYPLKEQGIFLPLFSHLNLCSKWISLAAHTKQKHFQRTLVFLINFFCDSFCIILHRFPCT